MQLDVTDLYCGPSNSLMSQQPLSSNNLSQSALLLLASERFLGDWTKACPDDDMLKGGGKTESGCPAARKSRSPRKKAFSDDVHLRSATLGGVPACAEPSGSAATAFRGEESVGQSWLYFFSGVDLSCVPFRRGDGRIRPSGAHRISLERSPHPCGLSLSARGRRRGSGVVKVRGRVSVRSETRGRAGLPLLRRGRVRQAPVP